MWFRYAAVLAMVWSTGAIAEERYTGICEASAGVFLDADHFAVASDESNVLRIYRSGAPQPVGRADMRTFTDFDKSDIEGAAVIGDRIYWISSHSYNSDGEDKKKRKVLFATDIVRNVATPTLKPAGKPFKNLRDPLIKALGVDAPDLNIEGLAATPDAALLIGLREPLKDGKALLVRLDNPAAVVETGETPKFSKLEPIDLKGGGVRSLDRVGSGDDAYLVAAGPSGQKKSDAFSLFAWDGALKTRPLGVDLKDLGPEVAMKTPTGNMVRLLSDDGDKCAKADEHDDAEGRAFRSLDVTLGD